MKEFLKKYETPIRLYFSSIFLFIGIGHFIFTDLMVQVMPSWIPFHRACVLLSGVAEISLAIALQIPKTRRLAAWGLVALLIAVYPANINMAVNEITTFEGAPSWFMEVPPAALWMRLPLQFLLIWWAWLYTRAPREEAAATA